MSAGEEEEDERDVNDGEFDDKTGKSADGDYTSNKTRSGWKTAPSNCSSRFRGN